LSPFPFLSLIPAAGLTYLVLAYDAGRALTFVVGAIAALVCVRAGVEWGRRSDPACSGGPACSGDPAYCGCFPDDCIARRR
jgi:hypothetical protein